MSIETVLLIVILTFGLGFVLNRLELGRAGSGAAVCGVVSGDGAAHDRLRRVTTRRQAELASRGTGIRPG